MRTFRFALFSFLFSSLIALAGCAGFQDAAPLPIAAAQVHLGPIHGSNFGGHAPIAGAHVFILDVTDNGYGGQVISRLDTVSGGAVDFTGVDQTTTATPTVNPTFGLNFEPTDASGSFNFDATDYTCTSGDPIYLYAQGGSTTGVAPSTASVNYISAATNAANGSYQTVTITTQTPVSLAAGAAVTLSGFKDVSAFPTTTSSFTTSFASSVVAAVSGSTTFQVTVPTTAVTAAAPGFATGTTYNQANFGTSVIATYFPTAAAANPQIVNMAMLGVCPGTATEFNAINFVYMNEVSTVAMAEAMAGFAGASGLSTDAVHIGTSSNNTTGAGNAAMNANQLYDIQGGNVGTGGNGDAHIARITTPAGNGLVPQATLDTIANILAACVDDSTNTYNPWALTATGTGAGMQSTATCQILFQNATSTGVATTTLASEANDTATAALNIAHYPGGTAATVGTNSYNTTFVPALYKLQKLNTNSAGTANQPPFVPNLTTQPNDFSLAIQYALAAGANNSPTANPDLKGPESIAIDASGDIYIETLAGQTAFEMSPLGVVVARSATPSYTSTDGFSGNYGYGYLSIDPNGNAWAGNANALSLETELTSSAGSTTLSTTTSPSAPRPYEDGLLDAYTTLTDDSGDIFVGAAPSASYDTYNKDPEKPDTVQWGLLELTSGTWTSLNTAPFPPGFKIAHGAIDASGNVWLTTENYSGIGCFTSAGADCLGVAPIVGQNEGFNYTENTALNQPEQPAIDASGALWVANQYTGTSGGGNLARVVYTPGTKGFFGTPASETTNTFTGGNMDQPFGTAIDGLGRIWVTNRCTDACDDGTAAPVNNYFSSVLEFDGSGDVLSPQYNFRLGSMNVANQTAVVPNPLNIAIDQSGVMWVTSVTGDVVGEVLGMAAPSSNPLSVAAAKGGLGARP